MDTQQEGRSGVWHLDKTVNLSVVFMVFAQFGGMLWWVSGVSNRVETATSINQQQDTRIQAIENVTNAQAITAATTAAQLAAVRESLSDLKNAQSETNRLLRDLVTNGAGK